MCSSKICTQARRNNTMRLRFSIRDMLWLTVVVAIPSLPLNKGP